MNPDIRKIQIRIEILRALDELSGLLEPQDSLLNRIRLTIQPLVLDSEFREALADLEAKNFVVGVREQLGNRVKWGLADKGRAYLASS